MNIGPYSYSKLATYKQCQLKAYLKYEEKLPDPMGPAADRGKILHSGMEEFTDTGDTSCEEISPIWKERLRYLVGNTDNELKFGFDDKGEPVDFFDKNVFFRGVYDAVYYAKGDAAYGLLEYKSGKPREEHVTQLGCYARSLFVREPDLKVVAGEVIYLDYPKFKHHRYTYDRGPEKHVVNKFMTPIWTLDLQIRNDNIHTACQSPLCGWCAYSKAKGGPCKF